MLALAENIWYRNDQFSESNIVLWAIKEKLIGCFTIYRGID